MLKIYPFYPFHSKQKPGDSLTGSAHSVGNKCVSQGEQFNHLSAGNCRLSKTAGRPAVFWLYWAQIDKTELERDALACTCLKYMPKGDADMGTRSLRELKSSALLFLWLLLVQTVCALFILVAAILALALLVFSGGLVLSGATPLWGWIAYSVPICLFWVVMGRLAPHSARPGPVGTVVVLTIWAVLTSLMRSMELFFLAQSACGGMLEQILQFLNCSARFDKEWALTIGCFLLPAALGMGLLLGRKR